MTTVLPLSFDARRDGEFAAVLGDRVRAVLRARGTSDRANAAMVLRIVLLLGATVASYAWILGSGQAPVLARLAAVVAFALCIVGVSVGIAHDALHGAISQRRWVNRLLALTSELAGVHGYQWRITHNRAHHVAPNVFPLDGDVALDPVLRLSPANPWRSFHRAQHVYAWLVYATATLFWGYGKDFLNLAAGRLGPLEGPHHPARAYLSLVLGKAAHYGLTIVVPCWVLGPALPEFAVGFLLFHLVAGSILGTTFMLAHAFEATTYPSRSVDGAIDASWHAHQLRTTQDFARDNRLVRAALGGLNYQVEHHLFPTMCSIHYAAISPVVEATAREFGFPFHASPTVGSALADHARALRRLGARPTRAGPDREGLVGLDA